MSRVMSYFLKKENRSINILVATSGDTGSAVAQGFLGVPGIHITILYPSGKVSVNQEKQLTTFGQNITALEIDGVFDDCQTIVKQAFLDKELDEKLNLSSANSINIARLIPQSFYYFWAYAQVKKQGKKVAFLGNEKFKPLCDSRNIDFISVSDESDYEAVYGDLSTWSSAHSNSHYVEFHLPAITKTFSQIESIVLNGFKPAVVYQDAFSGANLAAEKYELTRCKVVLAPSAVFSSESPPFPLRAQIKESDWGEGMAIVKNKSRKSSYTKLVSPYLNAIRKGVGLNELAADDLDSLEECDVSFGLFP